MSMQRVEPIPVVKTLEGLVGVLHLQVMAKAALRCQRQIRSHTPPGGQQAGGKAQGVGQGSEQSFNPPGSDPSTFYANTAGGVGADGAAALTRRGPCAPIQ